MYIMTSQLVRNSYKSSHVFKVILTFKLFLMIFKPESVSDDISGSYSGNNLMRALDYCIHETRDTLHYLRFHILYLCTFTYLLYLCT